MGISLFIGETDEEIRLGNAKWYHNFLNRAAELGECPNLFNFPPDLGVASPDRKGSSVEGYLVSLGALKEEIESLKNQEGSPEWFEEMCDSFLEAIELCSDYPAESLTLG